MPVLVRFVVLTSIAFSLPTSLAEDQPVQLAGLADKVEVYFDRYGIPHIHAANWTDAARALGYVQAGDRLWQMDMFRRQASGATAEVIGKSGLESDILVRQLGIRRGCEELWRSDQIPPELRAELIAFAEGVNARMEELGKDGLPLFFKALGYEPAPWTPVDSLVFNKYMGWDQSGTHDDLWFGMIVEKLGVAAVEELWPLDRPYEEPTVVTQVNRHTMPARRQPPLEGAAAAYRAALEVISRARSPFRGLSYGSNNWAVDGTKTVSGKPILCNDPHLGFQLPSIWYSAHLCVGGKNVVGATFPGSPGVVVGHNDHIAWGVTNLQTDTVDYYVETIHPDNPRQYKHRGAWHELKRVSERIPVKGELDYLLDIDYTIHGPIINDKGRSIALCWTGLGPTTELLAFWEIQRAENLRQFLSALDKLTVPALNMIYADVEGNIAIHPCGAHPVRLRGQGRMPLEGASGDYDWQDFVPRSELPLAVNPDCHYVASANNRPAGIGYPHYLGWMWDCSYRKRRINELLAKADRLSIESMRPIQLDAYDKAAERFLPPLLSALPDDLGDPLANQAREELSKWDFVASGRTAGPAIWLRWFATYRASVWDDEWEARGVEKVHGSWGFSGTNGREPMIEVLEYLTREFPTSIWFDDRRTPRRETRNDVALQSFLLAVQSLKNELGDSPQHWRWDQINKLRVRSLSGQDLLSRDGGPVPGTAYTVNPGSNVGRVGGGASYRLIVDLADTERSIGVFPGGQSEIPSSPHYADQIPLWARGEYVPLSMTAAPPAPGTYSRKLVLAP
jgi:penicillin amidase